MFTSLTDTLRECLRVVSLSYDLMPAVVKDEVTAAFLALSAARPSWVSVYRAPNKYGGEYVTLRAAFNVNDGYPRESYEVTSKEVIDLARMVNGAGYTYPYVEIASDNMLMVCVKATTVYDTFDVPGLCNQPQGTVCKPGEITKARKEAAA